MRFEASAFLRARAPPCAPRGRIHRVRRRRTDGRTRAHGEGGGVGGGGQGLAGRGGGGESQRRMTLMGVLTSLTAEQMAQLSCVH